uniref:Reverse transcriptase domain-containing protein n=1 Tax=Poecilia latipinna TaxID=48699 RepID=A0A3B3UWC8_9TELE
MRNFIHLKTYLAQRNRKAEVRKAITSMKTAKSAGIDGFTAEYCHKCFQYGTLPESFNQAIIILLPKVDKDSMDPDNHRPISLINVDCKVFSKILATRLGVAMDCS